jgi:hypothetical protein
VVERRRPDGRWLGVTVAALLAAAACGGPDDASPSTSTSTGSAATDATPASDGSSATEATDSTGTGREQPPVADGPLPVLDRGRTVPADLSGPSAELVTLSEDPYVAAAVYPRPDYEANPWSQWGQGIVLDGGRVLAAMGDHLGPDGNSYLFLYDPEAQTVTRIADVLSAMDRQPGSWGYGKIHSQMVDPGGSSIYFATYYGTRRDLRFDDSYQGDVLFALDKTTLELTPVALPAPQRGIPSLASDGQGLVYGEAVDPLLDEDSYPAGGFFVYDTITGEVLRFTEDDDHAQFRNVMVGQGGTAWFARAGGSLFRYEPAADEVSATEVELGGELRASTAPAPDGTIYGVTDEPYELFAFDPAKETVQPLGEPLGYTASLALLPDGSGFLYVPGAHGDSGRVGTPLISVDGASGEQTTIVELQDLVRDELDLVLGGTYSITVDPERNQAHIGFNAGTDGDEPWGEAVFVVVELP